MIKVLRIGVVILFTAIILSGCIDLSNPPNGEWLSEDKKIYFKTDFSSEGGGNSKGWVETDDGKIEISPLFDTGNGMVFYPYESNDGDDLIMSGRYTYIGKDIMVYKLVYPPEKDNTKIIFHRIS